MPTPEEPSSASSKAETRPVVQLVYYEYCYTVQIFAQEGDISWAGTYGVHPTLAKDARAGDGERVKAGLGREGRITGGNDLIAANDADAIEQLNVRYGEPNVKYRILSLDRRGSVGLGGS